MNNPTSANANVGTQCGPTGQASTGQTSSTTAGETGKSPRGTGGDAGSVKDQAKHQVSSAKRHAAEVAEQAKRGLNEATEKAKQSGREYAADKKRQVGGEIGVFSDAIRCAAETLHQEQHDSIACYADAAAEQLDRLRETIESRSSREWIHDARNLIHRRPEIVYGGLFVAGLAMVRFLKASSPEHTGASSAAGYRSQDGNRSYRYEGQEDSSAARREASQRSTSQPLPRPYSPATTPGTADGPFGTSGTSSDVEIDREMTIVEKPEGDKR